MIDEAKPLRRGWTTGACATAALRAAMLELWRGERVPTVKITLPRGERPEFAVAHRDSGPGWAEAGIIKDEGDDPDVTHGAMIIVRVSETAVGGIRFLAVDGVGTVTRPGLPIAPGEPAINPVPRQMMQAVVADLAQREGRAPSVDITVSIPGGRDIAEKTWNPRLGILGGLSVLGTTGIVRPFSCAAWIASIHRGIDVARAVGLTHVAGCTGATSEKAVQELCGLPDIAMLDMGDFYGGMVKYLRRHPVGKVTIGGGLGKLTKLAQGAVDLHSGRSTVDFPALAQALGQPQRMAGRPGDHFDIAGASTVLEVYENMGGPLVDWITNAAREQVQAMLPDACIDIVAVDRAGRVVGRA